VADTNNLTTMNPSIEFVGKLLGNEAKAKELADFNTNNQNQVSSVVSKIPDSEKSQFTMLMVLMDFKHLQQGLHMHKQLIYVVAKM